ncbi:MAG: GNAT family N-acetyltransferase [Gallicola sp.]|nr:GNAT family N-acetyltransferase [Gallicola sp.]
MKITTYQDQYMDQIIDLILHIQNEEAKIDLSIDDQPDLLDIPFYYEKEGGGFWVALEGEKVIGTIACMNESHGNGVMKKFFVLREWRSKKIGLSLYRAFLEYVKMKGFQTILLDTPSVAKASHRFYERAGFKRISREELPFDYEYPDRDSYLYLLRL